MKFYEWYLLWYQSYKQTGLSLAGQRKYQYDYKVFKESFFGNKYIEDISKDDIQAYIQLYGEAHVKNTVKSHLNVIKACLNIAKEENLISNNPAKGIVLNYSEKYLSNEELVEKINVKKWLEIEEYIRLKSFLVSCH